MRRVNTTRIMAEYRKKMEELGTREGRDEWCLRVEQDLGCSTEERVDGVPPGLLRVRKLENDIMNVVSYLSVFLSITDTITFSDRPGCSLQDICLRCYYPSKSTRPHCRSRKGFHFQRSTYISGSQFIGYRRSATTQRRRAWDSVSLFFSCGSSKSDLISKNPPTWASGRSPSAQRYQGQPQYQPEDEGHCKRGRPVRC